MQLYDIVTTSRRVRETCARSDKIRHLAVCLRQVEAAEIKIAIALLSGEARQGRIGLGPATPHAALPPHTASKPELTLAEVDATLGRIAQTRGAGAPTERARLIGELFARATKDEQDFLLRTALGELRQGALEGLMIEAVGQTSDLLIGEVRRAVMVSGDLRAVATAALEGRHGLAGVSVQLFQPLKSMLAQTAEDSLEALQQLGTAAFEYKLDGARIQVHKEGSDVRIFTRYLNDVTAAVPEIVESVRGLAIGSLILDGEALARHPDGRPRPFQVTMRRFGRKLEVGRLRESIPLHPFFFDCLFIDGNAILDRPGAERAAVLAGAVPDGLVVARRVTGEKREAEAFLQAALAAGHEGVMAKALEAPYEAGARGGAWLKIKPATTLDLVVLAAEWGNGRRTGWLSNLHLGARNPSTGAFVMLGKTFKSMTDDMLAWQTAELRKLAITADTYTVYVEPKLVVEGRLQRHPGEPPLPRRTRLAPCPRQALPLRQEGRRRRHDRDRPRHLRAPP